MESIGEGVPGYVTPKVAIGAVVGNDAGEILLVQRADCGVWLYPTGWADVGYSPAEVAVKEVAEETGIECEPVQAARGDRRPADGLHPLRACTCCCSTARPIGGELAGHPLETADVGWFSRDALPWPLRRRQLVGADGVRRDRRRDDRDGVRPAARADVARRLTSTLTRLDDRSAVVALVAQEPLDLGHQLVAVEPGSSSIVGRLAVDLSSVVVVVLVVVVVELGRCRPSTRAGRRSR